MKRVISLAAVLLLVTFIASGCGQKEKVSQEEKLVPVETLKISSTALTPTLNTTGEIIAGADVNVMPKVTGRVQQVMVKVGDTVHKGQTLLQLEENDAKNSLDQAGAGLDLAQANLERAQQALKDAQVNFERNKSLYEAQAISKSQYEQAESGLVTAQSNLNVSQAQLKQAQATLNSAQDNHNNFTLTSPIDGVVAAVNVDSGEITSPQASPITVVQINSTKVKVNVSENVVDSIKVGSKVPVTINAINKTINGNVLSVAPKADPATRAFTVEIQLPNDKGEIKPGMVAKLNLSTGSSAAVLALPLDAVLEKDGQYTVFIVENGKAKEVSVKVGITSGELIEIKSGVKEGQTVVVTGNRLVANGQKVKVVKEIGGAAK
ncbi:efflux transporter, RND family, MFP subunit [Desulfofarcimen acetoxidans DSM 771]|uniref:Efflux transporter, RND family, MFP subunit n=1 Tax=Desulfofarcimen acetoxidans (strain ATCC 49208 / DSM 771 / KCTC 5769 / VKM B-1644 / 5575) TaxID=485916 RepID=C8VY97_DESAS|nr:efflux RND transporter periplasmic adaptor subunit [Desulfofarcimen acetoxidans]ACV62778.1 efflux transporter, RND family, MFP subunit [Desulfofarcimen acetoxidans DSM 771]